MNAWDVLASLARRWYLTLAGVACTAVLVVVALQLVHPSYVSRANVVLLPPKSAVENGGNPYLQLGGLVPTLDLLSVSLSDEETKKTVAATSPGTEYEAVGDTTNAGPVLAITATSSSPAGAVGGRDVVVAQVPLRLQALQERLGIAERSQITSMVLTQDPVAVAEGKDQVRAAIVAAAVGLGATALLVALLDGALVRRRTRSAAAVPVTSHAPTEVPVDLPEIAVDAPVGVVGETAASAPTPREPARPTPRPQQTPTPTAPSRPALLETIDQDARPVQDDSGWSWGDGSEGSPTATSPKGSAVSSR